MTDMTICEKDPSKEIQSRITRECSRLGKDENGIMIRYDFAISKTCYTKCFNDAKPMLYNTIQVGNGEFKPLSDLKEGDPVSAYSISKVASDKTIAFFQDIPGNQESVFIEYTGGGYVVLSQETHVLLGCSTEIRAASRLAIGDELNVPNGDPVEITSITLGEYDGAMIRISTEDVGVAPDKHFEDHLFNIADENGENGIMVASYPAGLYNGTNTFGADYFDKYPEIGTRAYKQQWEKFKVEGVKGKFSSSPKVLSKFYSETSVEIPKDAHPFLSETQATEAKIRDIELKASGQGFQNDEDALSITHNMFDRWEKEYPDVVIHLEWDNEVVNAWTSMSNGIQHITFTGGIIRHPALSVQGLSVIFGHEKAHFSGQPPFYPNSNATCEGKSDWLSVKNEMRKVYLGEEFGDVAIEGARQMADLFNVPLSDVAPEGDAFCAHPPGACRVATYVLAATLTQGVPACSGSGPKPTNQVQDSSEVGFIAPDMPLDPVSVSGDDHHHVVHEGL